MPSMSDFPPAGNMPSGKTCKRLRCKWYMIVLCSTKVVGSSQMLRFFTSIFKFHNLKGLNWILRIKEFQLLFIYVEFLDAQVQDSSEKFHCLWKFRNFLKKNLLNSSKEIGPKDYSIWLGLPWNDRGWLDSVKWVRRICQWLNQTRPVHSSNWVIEIRGPIDHKFDIYSSIEYPLEGNDQVRK